MTHCSPVLSACVLCHVVHCLPRCPQHQHTTQLKHVGVGHTLEAVVGGSTCRGHRHTNFECFEGLEGEKVLQLQHPAYSNQSLQESVMSAACNNPLVHGSARLCPLVQSPSSFPNTTRTLHPPN